MFRRILNFCPGNSSSLLWEEDFLLWRPQKMFRRILNYLSWKQHQFIMGGGFFIMGGLKKCSEGF